MLMAFRPRRIGEVPPRNATPQQIAVYMADCRKVIQHNNLVVHTLTPITVTVSIIAVMLSITAIVVAATNG